MTSVHPTNEVEEIAWPVKSIRKFDLRTRLLKYKILQHFRPVSSLAFWKRKNKNDSGNGSFHEAIGSVLALAQFFAVMPVVGVKRDCVSKLEFKWGSFRAIYAVVMISLLICYDGLTIYTLRNKSINFEAIMPIVFHSSVIYSMVMFMGVARDWPSLMQYWDLVESKMPKWRSQREKRQLASNIKTVAFVVLFCSFVEHVLNIYSVVNYAINCINHQNPIEFLMIVQLKELFEVTSYSPLKAFFGKILNLVATFSWTYMDLFVILMSIGISSKFKQFNSNLELIKGEHMPDDYWEWRRSQYQKLANLCKTVDRTISHITLMSFSNNLFFICNQLMHSLRQMPSFAHALYFWYSLIFLILKTLALSLYAAEIYDESKKPIDIIRAVPHDSWCVEVQRFAEEVVNGKVAFSGRQFFYITRQLILSVAGTIVTYELVLYQFNFDEDQPEKPCPALIATE